MLIEIIVYFHEYFKNLQKCFMIASTKINLFSAKVRIELVLEVVVVAADVVVVVVIVVVVVVVVFSFVLFL